MKSIVLAIAALSLSGCSHLLPVFGYPPHAFRQTPPAGIDDTALAVGSVAAEISLPVGGQGTWTLADALKDGPVVLLFYRGAW